MKTGLDQSSPEPVPPASPMPTPRTPIKEPAPVTVIKEQTPALVSAPPKSTTESAPPTPATSDEDGFDRKLTKEEYEAYVKKVTESDGFDVENLPPCTLLAPIQPLDMDSLPACFDLKVHSQHALDEYNRRFQGELEFVKILKVMFNATRYFHFYITLEAKDLRDGGNIKTYQTVVTKVSENDDYDVSSFRLKPLEDEQGTSNQPKAWFWKDPC